MLTRTLFVSLALLMVASVSGWSYQLEIKDKPGVTRTYRLELHEAGHATYAGKRPLNLNMKASFLAKEQVRSVNGGVASVAFSATDFLFSGNVLGKTAANVQIPSLHYTFDRTPQGKVSNVQVADGQKDLLARLKARGYHLDNNGTSIPMYQQMNFPITAMSIGDGWGMKLDTHLLGMHLNAKAQNTLVGERVINGKKYVQINGNIDMAIPMSALDVPGNADASTVDLAMRLTGKAYTLFDVDAGEIYRSTFSGEISVGLVGKKFGGKKERIGGKFNMQIIMQKVD